MPAIAGVAAEFVWLFASAAVVIQVTASDALNALDVERMPVLNVNETGERRNRECISRSRNEAPVRRRRRAPCNAPNR